MLRRVLAIVALCCFAVTLSACTGGPAPLEKKDVKNKPGTNPKTGEVSNDNTKPDVEF